jgi:hypothetical protein
MKTHSKIDNHCLSCQTLEGVPTIDGGAWCYYASRNGTRMLVVERRLDQRIRINGKIEIIVVKIGAEDVHVGIHDGTAHALRAPALL